MHRRQAILILLALRVAAADFSGESAFELTRKAVSFGPRPSNSPAMAKQQAWMFAALKATGAKIEQDRFSPMTPLGLTPMMNLIARFHGASGRVIVVSGHYDTKILPGFVGANDGGSSTGLLLEMARALAGAKRRDDVWLVFFDGEEAVERWSDNDGTYGSRHLAAKWAREGPLGKIRALINVDMIGDRDLGILEEASSSAELRALVRASARALGFERHFLRDRSFIDDDHAPFLRLGVRAIDLIDFDYGPGHAWWHTPADTMDKLAPRSFEVVGKTVLEAIRRLEAER
jgi:Zn-dependent M28 family amino/carboxypeptidase